MIFNNEVKLAVASCGSSEKTRSLQDTMRMRQSLHRGNRDGDKSAIVKHAQHNTTRSPGKAAASSHPFHTGIPDEFEKPSRSYNTTQFHKIAGYTSTTSGTLSCRKHIIKHCFQVRNQLKSSTLQSSSHSPEDGQHRLTEISRHLLNLNSYFQNFHMVLPQASPHHLKTPWKATKIIS